MGWNRLSLWASAALLVVGVPLAAFAEDIPLRQQALRLNDVTGTDSITGNSQWSVGYVYDENGNLTDEKTREHIRKLLVALVEWTLRLKAKG